MSKPATLSPEEFRATFRHASKDAIAANTVRKVAHQLGKTPAEARRLLEHHASRSAAPQAPKPKRAGKMKGVMNKTEAEFFALLERRREAGEFSEVAYEPFALPIEGQAKYWPDFVAMPNPSRFTLAQIREVFTRPASDILTSEKFDSLLSDFASSASLEQIATGPLAYFFEVKGAHIWDDARLKFKAARDRYRWAQFEMHQRKGGEWKQL